MTMMGDRHERLTFPPRDAAGRKLRRPEWTMLRLALIATGVFACVALAFFMVGYGRFVASITSKENPNLPRTEAIVVVTGGAQRIGDAIGLLGEERGARLLISGVNEKTSREELARLNPSARDLLSCCVDLDYRARNTIGNAIETRRWAQQHGFGSILVVTSNYHMPRVLAEFAHAMPGKRFVAYPVVTEHLDLSGWWYRWGTIRLLVPEYVKYLAARLRSSVETDPETSRLSVIVGGRKPISPQTLHPANPDNGRGPIHASQNGG